MLHAAPHLHPERTRASEAHGAPIHGFILGRFFGHLWRADLLSCMYPIFPALRFPLTFAVSPLKWATNNTPNPGVRAVSTALIVGVGTAGAFIASWTYTNKEAPLYVTGHSINMGFSTVAIGIVILYWWYCSWENRQRDLGRRDHRLINLTQEEIDNLGHRHPNFRYAS